MKTYEVSVQKTSPSTAFGLALAQKSGSSQIMIRTISLTGAFAGTNLEPGLQLLAINGNKDFQTVQEATDLLKSAPVGKVKILVQGCVAKANKKDMKTKVGLSLKKITRPEGVKGPAELIIEDISSDGIFANSGLEKGNRISTINGKPCPLMLSDATAMIRNVVGELTVVAVAPDINKDDETPKGASLGAYLDKHHVSMGDSTFASVKTLTGEESQTEAEFTIEPNSEAAADRDLNSMPIVTDTVVEENGVSDSEYDSPGEEEIEIEPNSEAAAERMLNTPFVEDGGVIDSEFGEVPARNYHMSDVTTTISKGFPGEKVGLALKNVKETKTVIVNRLVKEGLAIRSRSPLSLGQTILYINGQKCPPSAKRATTLVTEAPRTITIIARNTEIIAKKETIATKLGITLRSSKRSPTVRVEYVDPNGLFGNTILAKGQRIVAINGVDCPDNAYGAIALLKSLVGDITVVVGYKGTGSMPVHHNYEDDLPPIVVAVQEPEPEMVEAMQEPENVGSRSVISNKEAGKWVGISMAKSEGLITVIKIRDESPLANSELQVGHAILYVNDVACPDSITETISMIQRASGDVMITSAPIEEANEIAPPKFAPKSPSPPSPAPTPEPTLPPPGQVVAKVIKSSKEEKIGIKVVRSLQNRIVISSITEGSLLSTTDLVPGQFIVSINGAPCPQTKEETVRLIRNVVGPVEIVASNSVGQATKATASTKVGITIGRTVANEMIIVGLTKDSILKDDSPWALRDEQLVVSINGEPCPANLQEAIGLIKNCVGALTIVAVDRIKRATPPTPASKPDSEKQSSSEVNGSAKAPQNGDKSMPARVEAAPELSARAFGVPTPKHGSSPGFKNIRAVVPNKEPSDMLGLSMGVTHDYTFVNHISSDSPFVDTDLCVGHRIAKIDGEDCPLSLSDAMELFAQHVGTMTIDAKEKIVSPGQVSASIVKHSQHANPGVGFAESDQGRVVISKIDPKGLFADTRLRLGQSLELVNGRSCLDAETSYDMLASASGKVTIIASKTVGKAVKQDIDDPVGIVLGQAANGKDIIVKEIEESGLLGKSDLKVGQRVVSIAGVGCPSSVTEAEGLIQDCVGELSITAVDTLDKYSSAHMENGNGFIQERSRVLTVPVYKESQQSKVGMKMRKGLQEGKVIISGLNEDGPMGGKGLEVGMYIISIGGIPCPGDPKTATAIIKEASGHFEIVASPTVASISKKTKDEKVGVALTRSPEGVIVVHSIASNSAFKSTDLQVGQKIVSINGKKCSRILNEAIKMLGDAVGQVTIVALDTLKT